MVPLTTRAATDRMFTKMQNQFGFLSPFSFPEMIKVRGFTRGCECPGGGAASDADDDCGYARDGNGDGDGVCEHGLMRECVAVADVQHPVRLRTPILAQFVYG